MPDHPSKATSPGTLFVVSTPIGNMEDMTQRARRVLSEVDLVAAEDTRTAGRLLKRLQVHKPLISIFEGNEHRRVPSILESLSQGGKVALITESGTPCISDPGAMLVGACVDSGVEVCPIPGPSAVVAALSVSGFDASRFRFEGFLPRRGAARKLRIESLRHDSTVAVLYESPARLGRTLRELADELGPRRALVAREITKLHEELARGTLDELAERYSQAPARGEITVVMEGSRSAVPSLSEEEIREAIQEALQAGRSPKDIARELAENTGRHRRELYAWVHRIKGTIEEIP